MRKGSSRGLRGYRQGSVGRAVGRGDRGGQRSGRHGAFRRPQNRRLPAASGARGRRPRVAAAPHLWPADPVHGDQGGVGLGRAAASRPGARGRVDHATLGVVRAPRSRGRARGAVRGVGGAAVTRRRTGRRPGGRERAARRPARRPAQIAPTGSRAGSRCGVAGDG